MSHFTPLARITGPEARVIDGFLGGEDADSLGAAHPDAVSGKQRFVFVHALVERLAEPLHVLFELVVSLVLQAADAERVRGEPRAAILLKDFQDLFPLAQAVKQRRQRADVERMRPQPEQVAGDALQFGEDRSNHARPQRRFRAQQFFDRLAIAQAVRNRRDVVHAVHVRRELLIAAVLGDFLDAAVQVADHAFRADDFFAVQAQFHAQHAVRGRVLRPHVEDDFVRAEYGGLGVRGKRNALVGHFYCPLSIPRFSRTQAVSCVRMS